LKSNMGLIDVGSERVCRDARQTGERGMLP
jgi:hypothetical protein